MILNEAQHRLLQDPKVKMIIEAFGAEPVDRNHDVRKKVAARATQLIQKAESNATAPKPALNSESVLNRTQIVSSWIKDQQKQFGPKWCPFCIALLLTISAGLTVRQQVVYPPGVSQVGQSVFRDRGPLFSIPAFLKHNVAFQGRKIKNYSDKNTCFCPVSTKQNNLWANFGHGKTA